MLKTRLCDILGIQYPIVQAPMGSISWADLAAAVSNAGSLGTLGTNAGTTVLSDKVEVVGENLRKEIRRTRTLTNKPFGINFPIGSPSSKQFCDRCVEVAIEEKVPVAITSMGSPALYTERFHKAGARVIHVTASVRHAKGAEVAGVDAVVANGYEAGGHSGFDELTTFVLVPQVADAVKIPVLAAGGIVDARGLIAALALGADAAYMGTRFLATIECAAHPKAKEAVLKAGDTDTVALGRKTSMIRVVKNEYSRQYLEKEMGGVSREELLAFMGAGRYRKALVEGDVEWGEMAAGAASGIIREILPAAEVVRRVVQETEAVMSRLNRVASSP